MNRLQIFGSEAGVFSNPPHGRRAKLFRLVPCPRIIWPARSLQPDMRPRTLLRFWSPANAQEGSVHTGCFTARPRAHTKRIDLGGFLTRSIRSASTRKASAVTFTSASCLVLPYVITPGKSGTSANHRPSASCSNSIRNDSESGGCGRVAIDTHPSKITAEKLVRRILIAGAF